jgi:phage-related protein
VKDLSTTVMDAALKQRENDRPFIRLLEVTLPNFECVRLANYDTSVTFEQTSLLAPIIWKPFPFAVGDIVETKRGDLPQIQIAISNVTLELMARIDAAEGLTDQSVRILIVNQATLSDAAARVLYTGDIIHCEANQDTVVFDLGRPSLMQASFPARRCLSQCSVVTFGDSDCGYVIPTTPGESIGTGFSTCKRSLDQCRERGDDEVARGLVRQHPKRMDGFPGTAPGNP